MKYLDVRTEDEWLCDHIDGAIHFELAKLEGGDLPDISKNEEIRVYCFSGVRAGIAKSILEKAGFTNVINARGINDVRNN